MSRTKFDYPRCARECALVLEAGGSIHALLCILVLVKLEAWFGPLDPRELDAQHFLLILCLGADLLERGERPPTKQQYIHRELQEPSNG